MAQKIRDRDPDEEIAKAFALFDEQGRGKIGFKDLRRVARELGEALADEEVQEMIDEADRDGDGEVDLEEFRRVRVWGLEPVSVGPRPRPALDFFFPRPLAHRPPPRKNQPQIQTPQIMKKTALF
jgi:hypothetical protein